MEKVYEWKIKAFAKGVDPEKAVAEFERIENLYGSLTPENILKEARNNDAVLNPLFTWDDTEAAKKYRLYQARLVLNNVQVTVVSDGTPKRIDVYEVVRRQEVNVYKHIDDFTSSDIEEVRQRTLKELTSLRNKVSLYSQFEKVSMKLNEAVELVSMV